MIGEGVSVRPEDGSARRLLDAERRLADLERRAQRGIGAGRTGYAVYGWGGANRNTPLTLSSSIQTVCSYTQAARIGDICRLDALLRAGGSSGAAGFVRLYLVLSAPSAASYVLTTSDSQPAPLGAGTGSDIVIPVNSQAFAINETGTWTAYLQAQTISATGTWVANQNLTQLRGEFIAPIS